MEKKRLMRSSDRVFFGVAGGLANYFNLDPVLVRLAFVVLTFLTHGTALLLYLVLLFLMPEAKVEAKANGFDAEVIVIKDAA